MEDRIIVDLPSREWAAVAVRDLADAGCRAEALPEPTASGWWRLSIIGTPEQLALIRAGMRTTTAP